MGGGDRIPNEKLLAAGLELMRQNGKPLKRVSGNGRSMIYQLPDGESVRFRTCNDHLLIVLAESPAEDARLNIEGTDWLVIVMPEKERTPGRAMAYLLPTEVAVKAARESHKAWLETSPNTRGENVTWNLWFSCEKAEKPHNHFHDKWQKYLLSGVVSTDHETGAGESSSASNVKNEVEMARQRISRAAGVPPEAVKITIEFGL
jgi:hypothetical protein